MKPCYCSQAFPLQTECIFQSFLKFTTHPFGEIADYAIRIEFQARGSSHVHCVIWVKGAPEYAVSDDEEVCDFIDQYVSCKTPKEDGKVKELVVLLQNHKYSQTSIKTQQSELCQKLLKLEEEVLELESINSSSSKASPSAKKKIRLTRDLTVSNFMLQQLSMLVSVMYIYIRLPHTVGETKPAVLISLSLLAVKLSLQEIMLSLMSLHKH